MLLVSWQKTRPYHSGSCCRAVPQQRLVEELILLTLLTEVGASVPSRKAQQLRGLQGVVNYLCWGGEHQAFTRQLELDNSCV